MSSSAAFESSSVDDATAASASATAAASHSEPGLHVELTYAALDIGRITDRVRSPDAGALVVFAGTTRRTAQLHPAEQQMSSKDIKSSGMSSKDAHSKPHGKPAQPYFPVAHLAYSAYVPRALRTMREICEGLCEEHALQGIALVHRLGSVPVGTESIVVAVSAAHRTPAWRAGEEALEQCKQRAEIWKYEVFDSSASSDANQDTKPKWPENEPMGAWRANAGPG